MTRHARRLAALAALAAVVAGCATTKAAESAPGLRYVALGDSVAAGYGLGEAAGTCARSPRGYPGRVQAALERRHRRVSLTLLACSGATAAGESGQHTLRGQVGQALETLSEAPAVVSITIGINDLGWWNPLRVASILNADGPEFDRWLDGAIEAIARPVEREVSRLLERTGVAVVLTEYYDPFNRASPLYSSGAICPLERRCRARVERAVSTLNESFRGLPGRLHARGRVAVARVQAAFRGHEAARPRCGEAPPGPERTWIQADCFHPNVRGAAAYARSVARQAQALGR